MSFIINFLFMTGLDGLDRKEVAPNMSVVPTEAEQPVNIAAAVRSLPLDTRIGVELALSCGVSVQDAVRDVIAGKLPNL